MIAIGFGVTLAGYAVFLLGYCWVRDYNVTPADLFHTTWPGGSQAAAGTRSSQVVPSPSGQPTTPQQYTGQ